MLILRSLTKTVYHPGVLPQKKKLPSFSLFSKWINLKATLAGAGEGGSCYHDWRPFSAKELRKYFGLYIFNGLSPSPRVENKLRPQSEDQLHGNDFIYHSFGANAERRHWHFKTFLAVQDPAIETPSRKKFLNWKVRPLLDYLTFPFPLIWIVGIGFAIDEMTIGFQGMHADKRHTTYKNEGYGFQCDALCQDGFFYKFYFRNEPSSEEYIMSGLSPLHPRVVSLFDTARDEHHICGMEKFYNSATSRQIFSGRSNGYLYVPIIGIGWVEQILWHFFWRTSFCSTVWLNRTAHFSVHILLLHHYMSNLAHLSYL